MTRSSLEAALIWRGDLLAAVNDTVPLYETYEDQINELRDWARSRARMATVDGKMAELFT